MIEKLKITIEQFERTAIRSRRRLVAFCPGCLSSVEMLSVDEAVASTGISGRDLIRLIECGVAHSSETTDGFLLVCAASLRCSVR